MLSCGLSSRETEKLVKALKLGGTYSPTQIKIEVEKIQASKQTGSKEKSARGEPIVGLLYAMKAKCAAVTDYLEAHPEWAPGQDEWAGAAREAAARAVKQLDFRLTGGSLD